MNINALSIGCLFLILTIAPAGGLADTAKKDMGLKIDVNKEDKEVGLERMKLIDKSLSRDLMERKRGLVKQIETDYNKKIADLLNSIIPSMFQNKVMTHIDVNYFASDFDAEVRASQEVSTALVIKRDGFNTWVEQNTSEETAKQTLKQLINTTFNIPEENISLLIIN